MNISIYWRVLLALIAVVQHTPFSFADDEAMSNVIEQAVAANTLLKKVTQKVEAVRLFLNDDELFTTILHQVRNVIDNSKTVSLADFGLFFKKIKLPQFGITLLEKTKILTPTFSEGAKEFERGFTITGAVLFGGKQVAIEIVVVDASSEQSIDYEETDVCAPQKVAATGAIKAVAQEGAPHAKPTSIGISITIELPTDWKLSDGFPSLKRFDEINLPQGRFIFSNIEYRNCRLGIDIKPGLNFVASVDLTGPFTVLQQVFNKFAPYLLVQAKGTAYFQGHLAQDILGSRFKVVLPTRMGVDFVELYRAGKLAKRPTSLSRIMLSDFIMQIDPFNLRGAISVGVIVGFVTQKNPIELRAAAAVVDLTSVQMAGQMIGIWEHAFGINWFSLGDLSLVLGIDSTLAPALVATTGVPFNLMGFGGTFGLGVAEKQATLGMEAIVGFSAKEPPSIVFKGKAAHLDLTAFLQFFAKQLGNPNLADWLIPMELSTLDLSIVPVSTTIVDRDYKAGVYARGALKFGVFHGVFDLVIDPDKKAPRFMFDGMVADIITPVFKFTGPGLPVFTKQGFEKGPAISMHISPTVFKFFTEGMVEIPPLGVIQRATLLIDKKMGIRGKFESYLFDGWAQAAIELVASVNRIDDFYALIEINKTPMNQSVKDNLLARLGHLRNARFADIAEIKRLITNAQHKTERLTELIAKKVSTAERAGTAEKRSEGHKLEKLKQELETQIKKCSLLAPNTWHECLKVVSATASTGIKAVEVELSDVKKVLDKFDVHVKGTSRIAAKEAEASLLALQKNLKKLSIVGIDLLSRFIDATSDIELHLRAEVQGPDLSKGLIPRFKAMGIIGFGSLRKGFAVDNLDFSTTQKSEESMDKVADVVLDEIVAVSEAQPALS